MQVLKSFTVVIAASFILFVGSASADTLFEENFNGYSSFPNSFPGSDPINFGVALTSEGAQNDWYGGRFETPDGAVVSNKILDIAIDIGVQKWPGNRPGPDPVGRVGDEGGMLFKIDTTNYENVSLTFDHRMFNAGGGDKLVVGYTTMDLDPFFSGTDLDPNDFSYPSSTLDEATTIPGTGRIADFFNDPAAGNGSQSTIENWWNNNWNEVYRANEGDYWKTDTIALPLAEDAGEVWVAFWLDNGDYNFGKIDNIQVTGDLIPEPTSLGLLGLGALALLRRRNK